MSVTTEKDEALRREIREFLDVEFPPERQWQALIEQHENQDHIDLDWQRAFFRKLGERGWLGFAIPEEYGGSGGTAWQRHIFATEMSYYGAPLPRNAIQIVAPALLAFGSEEIRQRYLPRIARGEINFSLGYTEPESGTDLASLRTSAVRDGDEYVIKGQKIFTSRSHRSEYIYLAARTSTEGKKHDGISLFIVPTDDPNVTIEPLPVLAGRTNITYYDGVRVPAVDRVGEENEGWTYLRSSLGLERIGVFPVGHIRRFVEEIFRAARVPLPDQSLPIDDPIVRLELSRLRVDLARLEALVDAALMEVLETGDIPGFLAAEIKVFLTEYKQRAADFGLEMLGPFGLLEEDEDAPFGGLMAEMWRDAIVHTFGAGANEVQRDMIASRALGLPRSR